MNKPPRGNPMAAEPAITPEVIAEHGLSAEAMVAPWMPSRPVLAPT